VFTERATAVSTAKLGVKDWKQIRLLASSGGLVAELDRPFGFSQSQSGTTPVTPSESAEPLEVVALEAEPELAALAEAPAPRAPLWKVLLPPLILTLVLWATFGLKLHNLDHEHLETWDESFHALVAQNVAKHPFKPTLTDTPYLPYNYKDWNKNHVWLHKPILPFWLTALSFVILGVDTFALRLPSVLLSTGAAGMTYLIARELFDRRTGLLAATLQAVNPFLLRIVHGYQFADVVDMSLLFWVEVGVYFVVRAVRTGSLSFTLLAGVAQGLAFLSKSYLAAIVFGLALTACLLPRCRIVKPVAPGSAEPATTGLGPFHLLALLLATFVTAAPWQLYCMWEFPDEFDHEHAAVFRHLYSNVEGWGAPWDRVLYDYLIAIYGVFYTPVIMALIALVGKAVAGRHMGLWLGYAWVGGVVGPHVWATTKTPSATIIAVPACFMMFGYLVSCASRGERWPLAALSAILFMSIDEPAVARGPGYGAPNSRLFGVIMRQASWVNDHVVMGLGLAFITSITALLARLLTPKRFDIAFKYLGLLVFWACVGGLIWLGDKMVHSALRVVDRPPRSSYWADLSPFAKNELPANAVIIFEQHDRAENVTAMFYTDRTCYPNDRGNPDELARQIAKAGGEPYFVTHRKMPLPVVHIGPRQGATIYRWPVRKAD
jgi:4-amino-4-deoxy-L-arabinose transferase-like glycosyltransferase